MHCDTGSTCVSGTSGWSGPLGTSGWSGASGIKTVLSWFPWPGSVVSAAMQEESSCDVKKSEGLQEEIQKRFRDNRRHLTKARNPISLNYLAFSSIWAKRKMGRTSGLMICQKVGSSTSPMQNASLAMSLSKTKKVLLSWFTFILNMKRNELFATYRKFICAQPWNICHDRYKAARLVWDNKFAMP